MAIVTAGITAAWGSTALGEVTEIRYLHGGSLPQQRGSTVANARPWSFDMGSVEVSFLLATAATLVSEYGRKGTLAVGGPPVNLTTKAILQTLDIGAKVNDVIRYKGTFKIVQE